MAKITVKYRGHLSALAGTPEDTFESADVESALRAIRLRRGREAEKNARAMLITLNGKSILLLKRYKTALKDGDVVSFFPICAGG